MTELIASYFSKSKTIIFKRIIPNCCLSKEKFMCTFKCLGKISGGVQTPWTPPWLCAWSPILSKTLMELIFNPCGEFRWSPEDSANSTLLTSTLVPLGSFQMQKATESYRTYSIPGKIAVLVPKFAVKDLPSAELQPRFLRLQWWTCPWAEHTDDDDVILKTLLVFNASGVFLKALWTLNKLFYDYKISGRHRKPIAWSRFLITVVICFSSVYLTDELLVW